MHADIAATFEDVVVSERKAYRADRRDEMRAAGEGLEEPEIAVRAAAESFDEAHRPWRETVNALAMAKGVYASAVLLSEDHTGPVIRVALQEAFRVYGELRRHRPSLPELPEDAAAQIVDMIAALLGGDEESDDE